jgi:hypothetical protein
MTEHTHHLVFHVGNFRIIAVDCTECQLTDDESELLLNVANQTIEAYWQALEDRIINGNGSSGQPIGILHV